MNLRRGTYDPEAAGAQCSKCPLQGSVYVPPEGPSTAELVVVGEAPGMQELKQRRPFVGPAGVKLNALLQGAGLDRSRVFLTNAVLCRPEVPGLEGARKFDLKTYLAWLRKTNTRERSLALERASSEVKALKKWIRDVERQLAAGFTLDPSTGMWLDQARRRLAAIFTETPSPFDCCRPRLLKELRWFEDKAQERHRLMGDRPNGAVVVPAGNFANQAVTGRASIMKTRGHPTPVTLEAPDEPGSRQALS